MPEPGGPGAPPIFGRSVNPIQTGGGQIIPTYCYWPPQCFSPSGITDIYNTYLSLNHLLLRLISTLLKLEIFNPSKT